MGLTFGLDQTIKELFMYMNHHHRGNKNANHN